MELDERSAVYVIIVCYTGEIPVCFGRVIRNNRRWNNGKERSGKLLNYLLWKDNGFVITKWHPVYKLCLSNITQCKYSRGNLFNKVFQMCSLTMENYPGVNDHTELWADPALQAGCPEKNQDYPGLEHFFSVNFVKVECVIQPIIWCTAFLGKAA